MGEEEITMCDYVEYATFDEIRSRVRNPKWICRACGRAANAKEFLCEPDEL